MGAGKTCVGEALASRLAWRFIDLDQRIEARQQRQIADIFRQDGETAFRRLESEELQRVLQELTSQAAVVALGGGTFVHPANSSSLHNCSVPSVFLDAPLEELWRRAQLLAGSRPLAISENQFRQLYAARRRRYMEADYHVQTSGRRVEEVASEIVSLLQGGLGEAL